MKVHTVNVINQGLQTEGRVMVGGFRVRCGVFEGVPGRVKLGSGSALRMNCKGVSGDPLTDGESLDLMDLGL